MHEENFPVDREEVHFQRYINFMKRCRERDFPFEDYMEVHHILPKSIGGTDDFANLIPLTGREHYIAHMILWKTFGGKMTTAFWFMTGVGREGMKSRITSRQYEAIRKDYIEARKTFKPKITSESERAQISKRIVGAKNMYDPFTGHAILTNDIDKMDYWSSKGYLYGNNKLSKLRKGPTTKDRIAIRDSENNQKYVREDELQEYLAAGWKTGFSDEYKNNSSNQRTGFCWVNNGTIEKWINPEKAKILLDSGWNQGRLPWNDEVKERFGRKGGWSLYKGNEEVRVFTEEEKQRLLDDGWTLGKKKTQARKDASLKNAEKAKGKIWIHKDGKRKKATLEEFDNYYSKEGYLRGIPPFDNGWDKRERTWKQKKNSI